MCSFVLTTVINVNTRSGRSISNKKHIHKKCYITVDVVIKSRGSYPVLESRTLCRGKLNQHENNAAHKGD